MNPEDELLALDPVEEAAKSLYLQTCRRVFKTEPKTWNHLAPSERRLWVELAQVVLTTRSRVYSRQYKALRRRYPKPGPKREYRAVPGHARTRGAARASGGRRR